MKRLVLILFLVFFCANLVHAVGLSSGISFSDLFGEVLVIPGDDPDDSYTAELDTELFIEDTIETKDESSAILSLRDLSTFVLKSNSKILIGDQSDKDSKLSLLAGHVWVNVKKMMNDGSMDIEMSQAVAGIKGTNITCYSNRDGSLNRIRVLRGSARVRIPRTSQTFQLAQGEELTVKQGDDPELQGFDPEQENKDWQDQLSGQGSSTELGQVPQMLKQLIEQTATEFAKIKEFYDSLQAQEEVDESQMQEFKIMLERFEGMIFENRIIVNNYRTLIRTILISEDTSNEDKQFCNRLLRDLNSLNLQQVNYSKEIAKMANLEPRSQGAQRGGASDAIAQHVENIMGKLTQLQEETLPIRTQLANPSGISQDWFKNSLETSTKVMSDLDELSHEIETLSEQHTSNRQLSALLSKVAEEKRTLSRIIKMLNVVEIDSATLIEMQEIDDALSAQLSLLIAELDAYNSVSTKEEAYYRLRASLKILDAYAKSRRIHLKAQRLYNNIIRSVRTSERTAEIDEFESYWHNIDDRFQQLGIAGDELESRVRDLESQLSQYMD